MQPIPAGHANPQLRGAEGLGEAVPPEEEAKSEEDKKNYQTALNNFALMLAEPVDIDWCALGI